ncbi:MarR family winged helix-turn-helix transcriptional regulator [Streptomyces sp. NPDC088725]|uniref:MarR family winged helix-turn-helix transcriptional regulator n=1 Tax=Streptomyces sp. NPDC088725 TaxID=3365873 RepID=UPI0038107520
MEESRGETPGGISESAARAARDLRVVVGRVRRRAKEVSGNDELTPSQTSVVSRLARAGAASASGLAAAEGVRPQSMAAILAALDERGLIRRRPDPDDGRRQLVSLSEAGRELHQGGRQAREEWLTRSLQDLYTESERRTINEALALLERLTNP